MKQIENIFSTKTKPHHKLQIIVDIREKNSLVPSILSKLKANYKFEHLEIADYLIGDIAIERKAFSDFLSSMLNKRLIKQLTEIKKYPRYFLIIEGEQFAPYKLKRKMNGANCELERFAPTLSKSKIMRSELGVERAGRKNFGLDNNSKHQRHLGWASSLGSDKLNKKSLNLNASLGGITSPKFLENHNLQNPARGMILSIITDYEIPILFTQDEEDTANFLLLLAKKFEKPKQNISLRQSRSQLTKEEQKQFILEGFPGIGPTLAKQLIKKFKTLNNIFQASEEKLKQIPKFNENKIKTFQQLLTE